MYFFPISIFINFGIDFGPFWTPKIVKKITFFQKMEVQRRHPTHHCFGAAFGKDFGALRARFSSPRKLFLAKCCKTCVKPSRLKNLLWWLGRRGADQVDLIIWVAILVVQKLCRPLICDDFRVGCIASWNKLRSTSLLGSIWGILGNQNRCPNSILEPFFPM